MTTHPVSIVLAFVGATFAGGQSSAAGTKPTGTRPATTGPATQPAGLSPVTFVVTDRETGKPVPEFSYNYWVETKEGELKKWDDTWIPVQSPTGTILIDAPESCSISLGVRARDYSEGWSYPGSGSYVVRRDDTQRRFEVRLGPGTTVRGVVRDEKTGNPIAGSRVSPIIFMPPLFTADPDRFVTSDEKGRFELHGVDLGLGITAEHPAYLETSLEFDRDAFKVGEDGSASVEVLLRSGPDLHGTVRDPQGNPVKDVQVSDGAGKEVSTDASGKFVLRSPNKWSCDKQYHVSLQKEGYIEQSLCPAESSSEGLSIVLTPQPELTGQVLDEKGEPVRRFEVFAGPGKDPALWECSSENVDDPSGRFTIRIDEAGPVWVGVKAPGYALSEKKTDTNEPLDPFVFTLDRGYTVRATAIRPKNVGQPLKARLVPAFTARIPWSGDQMTQRQIAGVIDTTVGDDGRLELNHVAQGSYVLFVYGPGVTPLKQWVGILEDNQELGEIKLRGTGTVFGQAYRPREEGSNAWAFANGVIKYEGCSRTYADPWEFSPLEPISFTADEDGRFRVDGVPVGQASVSIPYHITADIIGAYVRKAIVLENTSTEVRFFVPDTDWGLPVNVTVGDGSEANWRSASLVPTSDPSDGSSGDCLWAELCLTPLSSMTVSFPAPEECDLAQNATIMLPDVQQGRYRLAVNLGWRGGICWEREIDVKSRAEPVTISLGAGSVRGRLEWSGKSRHDVQVWLTRGEDRAIIQTVSCDESGHFAFRFVPPGTYSLHAHDHEAGWCRIGPVSVGSETSDVGVHRLKRGGEISGTVVGVMGKEPPDNILATASNGVSIDISSSHFVGYHGEPFVFSSLWPDEWTVKLRSGDTVLASGKATLKGTEKARVDLTPE